MNPKYKKIYCCTPVAFHANDGFWIRDTGLISNTLRGMGLESKCIMPLPYYDDDQKENLLRTEYKNLKSVKWWKSQGIDALVLYSWGAPKYLPIARAVKKAGIRLHIHLDSSGHFIPPDLESIPLSKRILIWIKLKIIDLFRSIHLKQADIITTSPPAESRIKNMLFYGKWFSIKFVSFPAPVAPHFTHKEQIEKERKVVCVGRWTDDEGDKVKRPEYMLQTAKEIVAADSDVEVDIYGAIGRNIQQLYDSYPESLRMRIHLKGRIANAKLPLVYNNAQVCYCPSYSESTHIASAEAICCGCSLVISPRKALHVLHWYTSHNSGSIATNDTPKAMAQKVIHELNMWQNHKRNASEISNFWKPHFHVDLALHRIFEK